MQSPPQQRLVTPEQQLNQSQINFILIPYRLSGLHKTIQALQYSNELMRGTALFMCKTTKSNVELRAQLVERGKKLPLHF